MHLDDDPTNFNFENLMVGPMDINSMCKKPILTEKRVINDVTMHRKKCRIGSVCGYMKFVETIEESFFAYDCAKMYMCPIAVRDFVFDYGLIHPPKYEEHYTSAEALAARYVQMYMPHKRTPCAVPQPCAGEPVLRVIRRDSWKPTVIASIGASGVPFSSELDVVVEYTGALGRTFQFIMDNEDYVEFFYKKQVQNVHMNSYGYVYINGAALHRTILGLQTGDSHLHGCHGGA